MRYYKLKCTQPICNWAFLSTEDLIHCKFMYRHITDKPKLIYNRVLSEKYDDVMEEFYCRLFIGCYG